VNPDDRTIGFIGIGVMGLPMALNLLQSGARLVVWNRSAEKCAPLRKLHAEVAPSAGAVFQSAEIVILMLASEEAMDAVLERGTAAFAALVSGHTVIHAGTTSPAYSRGLAADIAAAGGRYVECPVSGSARQAQAGQLIAMLAGETTLIEALRPRLAPMLRASFVCGPVPTALMMKLAVNLFLITTMSGLCEAFHFAQMQGLDLRQFQAIVDAGPMASSASTNKLRKLVERDDVVEASISDVLKNNRLIAEEASAAEIATPLLDICHALFANAQGMGLGSKDMVAVLRAIHAAARRRITDRGRHGGGVDQIADGAGINAAGDV
jgi:3-hydroxyisobutyrate dehydrogenase